jgi:archaellum component FlaF (FlaF/FlaG flagellin family)
MISGIIDSNQKIVSNGLIFNFDAAQRRSYPTTGTTWTDLSGNGRNGTLTNGVTFNSGNGGRLVFDGTNDYIALPINLPLSNISEFTYSSFLNFTTSVYAIGTFFSFGLLTQAPNDILFAWVKSSSQLLFQVNNGLDGSALYNYTPTSNWINLCVVYNGSLSSNADKLKVYINSVQITLNFSTYVVPSTTATIVNGNTSIARYESFPVDNYFLGTIGNVSLYNRALTDAEVGQNFNAIKSRFGL